MQTCPSCGTEASADARFCATCGASLGNAQCANCGAPLNPNAQFCASCGTPVGDVTEERRLVTVLFADVTGSTELGERLDPERLRAMLQRYFGAMSAVLAAWNGTVEKYIGDAIMAVFGIPQAHEDDAQRACSAALEMLERLGTVNQELDARYGVTLRIRIGINSGEVVTPLGGQHAPVAGQLLVSGDIVNVASRLQSVAESDQVLVGPRTYLAARHAFAFGDEERLDLKGKAAPVVARRLERALPDTERGVPGLETEMIGRDRELETLIGLLDEAVEAGLPRLVTIYGTAGIGKSRLVRELIARVDGRTPSVTVLRGRSLSAGQGVTFWALAEWLRAATDTTLSDPVEVARERIGARVREIVQPLGLTDAEVAETVDALALTAGIGSSDGQTDARSPAEVADAMARAWPRFAAGLAGEHPAVLVVEDLHWADDQMLDLLGHVAVRAQGAILLVLTARPEFAEAHPGFAANADATGISLRPLTEQQGRELVDGLLNVDRLPEALRSEILARAEGNPFFVEELLRRLIDEGVIVREQDRWVATSAAAHVMLPDSIQALLAARLDGLPADEKRVVQEAAVVGRFFWPGALAADGPQGALRLLERRGLVIARPTSSMPGEQEYAFRHALIRDVAYASVPKARRALDHARVGAWLETAARDRGDELAEVVASHFYAAVAGEEADLAWAEKPSGRDAVRRRAVETMIAAGDQLRQRNALERALELHERALELVVDDAERATVLEAIGDDQRAYFHGDAAIAAYLGAAEALGDGPAAASALPRIAARAAEAIQRYGAFQQEVNEGAVQAMVERALELTSDPEQRARLLAGYGGMGRAWVGSRMGRSMRTAAHDPVQLSGRIAAAEEALRLAEQLDHPELIFLATDALAKLLWDGRDLVGNRAVVARQLEIFPRLTSARQRADVKFAAAVAAIEAGDPLRAKPLATEALEIARDLSPHDMMHASYATMRACYELGEWDTVLELFGPHRDAERREGDILCSAVRAGPILGAVVLVERGRREEALRLVPPDAYSTERTAAAAGSLLVAYARALGDDAMRDRWTRASLAGGTVDVDVEGAVEVTSSLADAGDWTTLREVMAKLEDIAGMLPFVAAAVARAEGLMLAAQGQPQRTVGLLRKAMDLFDAGPSVFEAALTREMVARFDVASAPELLASALASYERLGAEPRAAALRARIAESREQT